MAILKKTGRGGVLKTDIEKKIQEIKKDQILLFNMFVWKPLFWAIPFSCILLVAGYFYGVNGFSPVDVQGNSIAGNVKSAIYIICVIPFVLILVGLLLFVLKFLKDYDTISDLKKGNIKPKINTELEGLEGNELAAKIHAENSKTIGLQVILTTVVSATMMVAILIKGYFVGVPGFFPEDENGNAINYFEKMRIYRWMILPMFLYLAFIINTIVNNNRTKKRLDFLRKNNG